ncbi:hypothetical protein AUJ73_02940 [Candidatus Gottesmanbacteria bacterium CG1_02_37_22]|nr:MAG: hypothetical protein AUJ73_02940 [Candidatus Gottesmanbacteria bacterium CG1_02_37_22]
MVEKTETGGLSKILSKSVSRNMNTHVLATGMSGLVGTRIRELLCDEFEFTDLSYTTGIDITNYDDVLSHIESTQAKTIIHMAAKTEVDACEDEKILGEDGKCWLVNVVGTENVVSAAKKTGKKIIYISTDFVFDGTKDTYDEDDSPNPVNWYGYTKFEGEKIIQDSSVDYLIIRIAYPYRAYFQEKKDFVRRILENIKSKKRISGLTDHIFTPTFIDDIANALRFFINSNNQGIYHVVGSQSLTVYDAVRKIADLFSYKPDIEAVTRQAYFKNRAFRPFKLSLKNDKISKLGLTMKTFDEGLRTVKDQLETAY